MKALVVEDTGVMRHVLSASLRKLNFDVVEADNGAAAIDAIYSGNGADIIFVDWKMPTMDGMEFVRQLRRDETFRRIPVCMVSSKAEEAEIQEALAAGADDYMTKPFSMDTLREKCRIARHESFVGPAVKVRVARVLAADGSATMRKLLTEILSAHPELQLIGTASTGNICLQKVQQYNPDVIILDLDLPETDGLAVMKSVKQSHPHISTLALIEQSDRGAQQAFDAMQLGAGDFVLKNETSIRSQVISKLRHLLKQSATTSGLQPAVETHVPIKTRDTFRPIRREVVAIGVSTGGPNALSEFLPMLPESIPVPLLIVQHMPPNFTKTLADRLDAESKIHVVEAEAGMELVPGTAYLAPGDYHLTIKRSGAKVVTALNQGPQENSCRPAVDVLFRSVADVFGGGSIAVILTGMGKDGYAGTQILKRHGAYVIAQDKDSSVVWGMPRFVAEGGLANAVVPIGKVAIEVQRCLSRSETCIR